MSVRDPAESTCREVVELVSEFLASKMDPADQARFEQHLHACTWCMTYVDQFRATVAVASGLRSGSVAPETWDPLLRAFRRWKQR